MSDIAELERKLVLQKIILICLCILSLAKISEAMEVELRQKAKLYEDNERKKRVAVFDGGGVRGAISVRFARKFEEKITKQAKNFCDVSEYKHVMLEMLTKKGADTKEKILEELDLISPVLQEQFKKAATEIRNDLGTEMTVPMLKVNSAQRFLISQIIGNLFEKRKSNSVLPLHRIFGTISGTSTGSIIAAGLVKKMSPEEIESFYKEKAFEIFPRCGCSGSVSECCKRHIKWPINNIFHRICGILTCGYEKSSRGCVNCCGKIGAAVWYWSGLGCIGDICGCIGDCCYRVPGIRECRKCHQCCSPLYRASPLERILEKIFEEETFGSLSGDSRPNLQITAYSLTQKGIGPVYLHAGSCSNTLISDAIRASTAAPTFFPGKIITLEPSEQPQPQLMVDGGVADNSPVLASIIYAIEKIQESPENPSQTSLQDMILVSFGTGEPKESYDHLKASGCFRWIISIVDIALDGISRSNNAQLGVHLEKNYYRFQLSELDPHLMQLDQPQNVEELMEKASEFIEYMFLDDLLRILPGGEDYTKRIMEHVFGDPSESSSGSSLQHSGLSSPQPFTSGRGSGATVPETYTYQRIHCTAV